MHTNDHEIVHSETRNEFRRVWIVRCACGKTFTGRTSMRPLYAHEKHAAEAA